LECTANDACPIGQFCVLQSTPQVACPSASDAGKGAEACICLAAGSACWQAPDANHKYCPSATAGAKDKYTTIGTDQNCSDCGDDCGKRFLDAHAVGKCIAGTCQMATTESGATVCVSGWGDFESLEGCETPLNTSKNCGDGGKPCGGDNTNVQRVCEDSCQKADPPSDCTATTKSPGESIVKHFECYYECRTSAKGGTGDGSLTSKKELADCVAPDELSCVPPYMDCLGAPGCETNVQSDKKNCGKCGHDCGKEPSAAGELVCENGACRPDKCGGDPKKFFCSGTCTDAHKDAACTGCDDICFSETIYPGVKYGSCQGYKDGKEVAADNATSWRCKLTCRAGYHANCESGIAKCTETDTDVDNCGDCKKKCEDVITNTTHVDGGKKGLTCSKGLCAATCKKGWMHCPSPDNTLADGCETDLSQKETCGDCKKSCKEHEKCLDYKCVCDKGYASCDGKCVAVGTGCEEKCEYVKSSGCTACLDGGICENDCVKQGKVNCSTSGGAACCAANTCLTSDGTCGVDKFLNADGCCSKSKWPTCSAAFDGQCASWHVKEQSGDAAQTTFGSCKDGKCQAENFSSLGQKCGAYEPVPGTAAPYELTDNWAGCECGYVDCKSEKPGCETPISSVLTTLATQLQDYKTNTGLVYPFSKKCICDPDPDQTCEVKTK